MCMGRHWISWTLGIRQGEDWVAPDTQKKASRGSIVHKALELLARRKVAEQDGLTTFLDEETGEYPVQISEDEAFEAAYSYYTKRLTQWAWTARDYKDCLAWYRAALNFNDGAYHPLRRRVLWPEKFFELEIREPWARYSYETPNGVIEGYLGLKGSLDLVCYDGDGYELIDWKTGSRRNWVEGRDKSYDDLLKDTQLRLYHYALSRLLPDKNMSITIVYCKDGGAFPVPLFKEDLAETEAMLRRRFEEIRACTEPEFIVTRGDRDSLMKCGWCPYSLNRYPGSDKTVCDYLRGELLQLGMAKATEKYADWNSFGKYGDGGGVENRDGKKEVG